MSLIKGFLAANNRWSIRLRPKHVYEQHAYQQFEYHGTIALQARGPKRVVDIGAGKHFHFSHVLTGAIREETYLIGHDIDGAEMAHNIDLDERVVGDACSEIPVEDESIDIIFARATIEHLHDVPAFLRIAHAKLRPGGKLIVTFANKWAFFAILNRLVPARVAQWLLRAFVPGSDGILGFKAHYDHGSHHQFARAAARAGFIERVGYASFYGLNYFRFFTPLHILVYFLDTLRVVIGNSSLSSYNTFVLEKPGK